MADHSVEIAEIEELLNSGATEVSIDGQRVKLDHEALRKRLRELKAANDADIAAGTTRPVVSKFRLNGGW